MKQTQFESIKAQAEVIAVYGDKKSTATIKKSANLESVIARIENHTTESVTTEVLNHFKPVFKLLPRDVQGVCMKEFCNAIRHIIADNGTLFLFDNNGNIVARRALAKVKKSENPELFNLLANLLQDAARDNITRIAQDEVVASAYEAMKECCLIVE